MLSALEFGAACGLVMKGVEAKMLTIALNGATKVAGGCLVSGASTGVCASLSAMMQDIFWGARRRFGILRFRSDALKTLSSR